jgi:hypothetical protein
MTLTLQQRWRLLQARLVPDPTERERRVWFALRTTSELRHLAANHSSPAVQAELRRRGLV